MPLMVRFLSLLLIVSIAGCTSSARQQPTVAVLATTRTTALSKIKFPLDDIRSDGLRGPPDGLVSVAYEFCVPADAQVYAQIRRIDPSVAIHPGSRGRVGCSPGMALCIGSTHQAGWHDVLNALAARADVAEIRECFFE